MNQNESQDSIRLSVDQSTSDDVTSVIINPKVLERYRGSHFDALQIIKKNRHVYCVPIEDDGFPIDKIGISKQIRVNLYVRHLDTVRVKPVQLLSLLRIQIAPIEGSNVTGDLFTPYLKPFFLDAYRPVKKGLSFNVGRQLAPVNFKVLDITLPSNSPEGFQKDGGIVSNETEIQLMPEIESDENLEFVGYDDIGGQDAALKQVREVVELPLRHPELFKVLGIRPPSGVLMHGPPGTGKTLFARAIANETGAFFFLINGPEIMSKMAGESEANLKRAFNEAVKNAPAIIFIDEIDSIAPKRDKTQGEVDKRVVSMLLTLMDGLKKRKQVVVLAATNRPNALDPALRRFGRFDREIELRVPNEEERVKILKIHTRNMKLAGDVDLNEIAKVTHGMTGADLEQLCSESAYCCVREKMTADDFEDEKINSQILDSLAVTNEHFKEGLKKVDPSALRETAIESPNVHWDDLGGLKETKEALKEMVEYPLIYPEIFNAYGQPPNKGCLLWGPPGCGKTMLAKAIATECQANFIAVKGPELLTMWVGESEANVRDVFNKARAAAPCIIFFDEIDSLAHARGSHTGDSGVGDRMMNAILLELDGINPNKQIFVIGATNRPDILDPALTRPGRLDSMVYIGLPDFENRQEIFKVCLKKSPLEDGINFYELAKKTEGYSSADIAGLAKLAAKISIRKALQSLKSAKGEKEELFKNGYPPITKEALELAIKVTKPSVSQQDMQKYIQLQEKYISGNISMDNEENFNFKSGGKPIMEIPDDNNKK